MFCLPGPMAPTVVIGKVRVEGKAGSGAFASPTTQNCKVLITSHKFPPGAGEGCSLLTKAGLGLLSCGDWNKCSALTSQ